jgi:RNA polymerase sigma-70 factor (family 1)
LTYTVENSEKELLLLVAEGNESAFRQLYEQWQPQLSYFIFRITKSKDIAAEVVQDVFLKIWINREDLAGIDHFKSYLFIACRNQALNALRKAMHEMEQFQAWEKQNLKEISTETEDTETIQLSLIEEAIDHLSSRQKEIYLLHRYEKFTYQQIADKLGIGKETVKTHLELAVKSIAKYAKRRIGLLALLIEISFKNF